jgi:hypothetical protein
MDLHVPEVCRWPGDDARGQVYGPVAGIESDLSSRGAAKGIPFVTQAAQEALLGRQDCCGLGRAIIGGLGNDEGRGSGFCHLVKDYAQPADPVDWTRSDRKTNIDWAASFVYSNGYLRFIVALRTQHVLQTRDVPLRAMSQLSQAAGWALAVLKSLGLTFQSCT